jgi:hypothetical protein
MPQTHQDDTYDYLATFAETTYVFLVLLSGQRRLNTDELYILDRAAKVTAAIDKIEHANRFTAEAHEGSARGACC